MYIPCLTRSKPQNYQEEHEHQGKDLAELGESSEMNSEKLEQVTQKLEAQLLEKPKDKNPYAE